MRGWCFFLSWWCSKFNSCQVVKDKETNPSGAQKKEVTKNIYFWRYILKTNFQEAHDINRPLLLGRYLLCVCFRWVSQRAKIPFPCLSTSLPFPPVFDALTDCHCLQSKEKGWWNFYEDCKMLPGALSAWGHHILLASTFNQFHKWIHQPNYLCCQKIITHGF